jgi:hypothetical protein
MDVRTWLEALGLGQYARAFIENDIDFAVLPQLTDADLKELGVTSLGHCKRLLTAIGTIASPGAPVMQTAPTAGTLPGERRQVTVLFANLCGFTALSQTLDPEELGDLLGRSTKLVDDLVGRYALLTTSACANRRSVWRKVCGFLPRARAHPNRIARLRAQSFPHSDRSGDWHIDRASRREESVVPPQEQLNTYVACG